MHSEILKVNNGLVDFITFDSDEVNFETEISRLMDMINDHGTVNQIDAMEICKQRNWPVYKEFDPCHYYANEQGYLFWFDCRG